MSSIPILSAINVDLHLDVNGTLIAVDFADGRTVLEEDILQNFLAKKIKAIWKENQEEMTYMKYLENKYPSRESFRTNQKEEFSKIFKRMKKNNHPDLDRYRKMYDIALQKLQIMKIESQYVFPSVFRLFDLLQQNQIRATIFLRTFGSEGSLAAAEITKKFPNIQFQAPIDLRETTLSMHSLKPFEHQVIRENYKKWNDNGRERAFSKSLPIYDVQNRVSLFFDDNINDSEDCEKNNIVNPYNHNTGTPIPIRNLIGRFLFPIDTLEAIVNEEYFVELFNKALFANGYTN